MANPWATAILVTSTPAQTNNGDVTTERNQSGLSPAATSSNKPTQASSVTLRTRSMPLTSGVVFERSRGQSPPDDELTIVTVRVADKFRKRSLEGCEELPDRPRRRSFLKRISTRWSRDEEHDKSFKAIKMPYGDYKRYFARDWSGNYVGLEPEREWDEAELEREFGVYQDRPLQAVLS